MAVIASLPGVSVHIIDKNRTPLAAYYDEQDGADQDSKAFHSTQCYIEAKSEAAFGIRLQLDKALAKRGPIGSFDLAQFTYVDGDLADAQLISKSEFGVYDTFSAGRFDGQHDVQQDYHFSPLSIVEDSGKKPDSELAIKLAKTGTIKINLHRCTRGRDTGPRVNPIAQKPGLQDPISEKALKGQAISHSVKFGAPRLVTRTCVQATYPDQHIPLATFAFKYRSRAALQTIGLIPRDPPAIPLEDRPLESLNADEMRELLRRERVKNDELQTLKRKIKEERNANVADSGISDGHRLKRPRIETSEIEIVDLT